MSFLARTFTHRSKGTFVVSVYDIMTDLKRKEYIPISLKSVVSKYESDGLFTILTKESSNKFSFLVKP